MKTTVDIPDPLLKQAKAAARRQGRTLRDMIEAGLRSQLEKARHGAAYELPDCSVGGNGLRNGLSYDDWAKILEMANERGGG